ncbi:MAG: BrnT family toxin [Terriglobia bacterium]
MRFEWDEAKNGINQAKHDGLDFETAARVFSDPEIILAKESIVEGEQRWHAIGAVAGAVILVVHTGREEDDGENN